MSCVLRLYDSSILEQFTLVLLMTGLEAVEVFYLSILSKLLVPSAVILG